MTDNPCAQTIFSVDDDNVIYNGQAAIFYTLVQLRNRVNSVNGLFDSRFFM